MTKTFKAALLVGIANIALAAGANAAITSVMPRVLHEGRLELVSAEGAMETATDGSLKMMARPGAEAPIAFMLAVNEQTRIFKVTYMNNEDECGVVVYQGETAHGDVLTVVDDSGNRCHKVTKTWEATFVSPTEGRALWAVHAE